MQAANLNAKVEQQRDQPVTMPAADTCCAAASRQLGTRAWLIGGAVLLALTVYAGWDWLAVSGVATVLVAVGPCLLMCALGLCMGRGKSKGEMPLGEIRKTYETNTAEPPEHG